MTKMILVAAPANDRKQVFLWVDRKFVCDKGHGSNYVYFYRINMMYCTVLLTQLNPGNKLYKLKGNCSSDLHLVKILHGLVPENYTQ